MSYACFEKNQSMTLIPLTKGAKDIENLYQMILCLMIMTMVKKIEDRLIKNL